MTIFVRLFTHNWQAKLASLVIAVIVWYFVKGIVSPDPGDADMGTPSGFRMG